MCARPTPQFNADRTLALAHDADEQGAAVVVFPELGLSAYAIDDLLHQQALTDQVLEALGRIVEASEDLAPVLIVGAPLYAEGGLYNSAVVIHRGRVLGAVPKSYLPEYREYYEKRQFRAARDLIGGEIELLGARVPFGADLLFECRDVAHLTLFVEICEDFWAPVPPVDVRRAGRRDRADQPVGQQHHGRQVRLPQAALPGPVDADDRRLRVHGRGHGRVDHRPGLGRPGADLRARASGWPRRSGSRWRNS